MSDLQDFLAQMFEQHASAVTAVRSGDATPIISMLSRREPVTLFPAAQATQHGSTQVSEAFQRVASVYSDASPVQFEVLAAGVSGDLAYLVGHERGSASVAGAPAQEVDLRVTQVYRREQGEWKLVHRHGDPGPGAGSAVGDLRAALGRPDD
jgi:ketosteroid isomerase-like protein